MSWQQSPPPLTRPDILDRVPRHLVLPMAILLILGITAVASALPVAFDDDPGSTAAGWSITMTAMQIALGGEGWALPEFVVGALSLAAVAASLRRIYWPGAVAFLGWIVVTSLFNTASRAAQGVTVAIFVVMALALLEMERQARAERRAAP